MINIIKQPLEYTPVGNPCIWQIESTNPNIVFFNVSIIEVESETVLLNQKYFPKPSYVNGTSFNLSNILSNYVEARVENDTAISKSVSGSTLTYRLIITENVIDTFYGHFEGDVYVPNPHAGQIISGYVYDNDGDAFTVWDAKLDRYLFNVYNQNDYIINSTTLTKFLSIKPTVSNQTATSTEHLYFINDGQLAKKVRIRTYSTDGSVIGTADLTLAIGLFLRLNVSPKNLVSELGMDFSNVAFYTIDLLDESDAIISETKTYKYITDRCTLQPVNFLFTNSLGGVESFTMFNPKQTINYTKTYLKSNELQFNDGSYTDNVNGILNQGQKTINVTSTSNYTVFSNPLTDEETVYLKELVGSKNVYLELDETLVPIKITNSNYQVLLRATNGRKMNRLEIGYEVQSGFIPDIV